MDFQKFEEKLLENGAVFSFDGDGSEIKKIWFVWYRKINSDSFNVMLNTGCSDKLYAEQRKDKLVNNGILNKSFVVYGLSDLDLTNGKLTLDVKKEQKEQNKEQDQYIQKIAKCVRKDFLSNVNYISQIGLDEFVVLDTETTGIGKMDEVVELAALRLKNYKVIGKFHSYINPGVPISPKALEVHGLTKEFLAEKGRNAKDVFEEFKIFVNGSPIVGHNVNFDKDKIENHSKKSKVKIDLNVGFDTLELSRKMMNLPNHKLGFIIDEFGLRQGLKSHSAMDDVIATARYARALDKIYKSKCMLPEKNVF